MEASNAEALRRLMIIQNHLEELIEDTRELLQDEKSLTQGYERLLTKINGGKES